MNVKSYDTLAQAVHDLRQRGYRYDFNIVDASLHCAELDLQLHPEQFSVREVHRFEGDTDPGDENVLYAIESNQGVKGVLVSAYGPYADSVSDALMQKLRLPQS